METRDVKRLNSGIAPAAILLGLVSLSLYVLNRATRDPERFSHWHSWLLIISAVELVLLIVLIGSNVARLTRQYRNNATGSRLSARLVATFVLLSVLPMSVVYYFSFDFIRRGIDSWFDVRVETALQSALELSQASLDERKRDSLKEARRIAEALSQVPDSRIPFDLDELRIGHDVTELTVLTPGGSIIASSSTNPTIIVPNQPHESMLQQARQGSMYVALESIPDDQLNIRVLVRIAQSVPMREERLLQALFPVRGRVSELAGSVQEGYQQYQQLAYMREPLKLSFVFVLSIVLLLTLFTAVWAAFYSAQRLVAPIRILAIGTRLVSSGDYGKKLPLTSNDELGVLVQSFNDMTQKLAQARDEAEHSQQRAERQRGYLEGVLRRLSSGVLVLDEKQALRTANEGAKVILGFSFSDNMGLSVEQIAAVQPLFQPIAQAITGHAQENDREWREEVTYFGNTGRQVLMVRGAALRGDGGQGGYVIVFDDITHVIQAQRDAAWSEVARRLAHEIKNPLTPIQLAAERLRHKYLPAMPAADADVLDRATRTIVHQVEAMKEMVKAFSDYARPPKLRLERVDINRVIDEVCELFRDERGESRIVVALDATLPELSVDPGRIRQLLINVVKNAMEATAHKNDGCVRVMSRLADKGDIKVAEVIIEDNGPGIAENILAQIFEPYVTTKLKGSGLGLAISKKIVEEHSGLIWIDNRNEGGARLVMNFPLEASGSAVPESGERISPLGNTRGAA